MAALQSPLALPLPSFDTRKACLDYILNVTGKDKPLHVDPKYGGKRQVRWLCHGNGCTFHVSVRKHVDNQYKFTSAQSNNWMHGFVGDDNISYPCDGIRRVPKAEALNIPEFKVVVQGKLPLKQTRAFLANLGIPTSYSIVRDARASLQVTHNEQLKSAAEIEPFLQAMQEKNPAMVFKVTRNEKNEFESCTVVMPYAATVYRYCIPVLGIDGGHLKRTDVGENKIVHPMVIIALTSRLPGGHNVILAFNLCLSESKDNIIKLLGAAMEANVYWDTSNVVVVTDRGAPIISAMKEIRRNAHHHYCALHLKRNLRHNHFDDVAIRCFSDAVYAKTAAQYNRVMNGIKEKHNELYLYLTGIEGNWQQYKIIEKKLMFFEMSTNNIVEQQMAFMLPSRHLGPYFCLRDLMFRLTVRMNDIRKSERLRFNALTTTAETIMLGWLEEGKRLLYTATETSPNVYTVQSNLASIATTNYHTVDFNEGKCSCTQWSQCGIPCKHFIAVKRLFSISIDPATLYSSKYFHVSNLQRTLHTMIQQESFCVKWIATDDIKEQQAMQEVQDTTTYAVVDASQRKNCKRRFLGLGETGGGGQTTTVAKSKRMHCPICDTYYTKLHNSGTCKRRSDQKQLKDVL